jgi:hypothetical protein
VAAPRLRLRTRRDNASPGEQMMLAEVTDTSRSESEGPYAGS